MTRPSLVPDARDPAIDFVSQDHTYWFKQDGRQALGVNEVLHLAGLVDTKWFNERARVRGTYLHHAAALHDLGQLDEQTVDDTIKPYLDAYRLFLDDCTPVYTRVEAVFADDVSDVAGTIDRVGTITVKGVEQFAIIDLKTGRGGQAPWHAIQLAGYHHLLTQYLARRDAAADAVKIKRYGLYLRENGNYKLTPYVNPMDSGVFTSALTVAHWIRQCGGGRR